MIERAEAIKDVREFLWENYRNVQTFNTRNTVDDPMETVYKKNGITVDYCSPWDYLEIFGLTEKEYAELFNILNIC